MIIRRWWWEASATFESTRFGNFGGCPEQHTYFRRDKIDLGPCCITSPASRSRMRFATQPRKAVAAIFLHR